VFKSAFIRKKKKKKFAILGRELLKDEICMKYIEKGIIRDSYACVLPNLQKQPSGLLVWRKSDKIIVNTQEIR
jgi:hypothetical protein